MQAAWGKPTLYIGFSGEKRTFTGQLTSYGLRLSVFFFVVGVRYGNPEPEYEHKKFSPLGPENALAFHLCDSPISDSCVLGGFACFSGRDINVVFLGFVWCFGQAAKEEKLETEQEEDEPAAMTFLENFPGVWRLENLYNTSGCCMRSKVILPVCM